MSMVLVAGGCSSHAAGGSCSPAGWCVVKTVPVPPPGGPGWVPWGSSSQDVWFVGPSGAILHWDGTTFTTVPSGTSDDLTSISGTSSTDVWAAGSVTLHWNGTAWGPASSQVPGYPASPPVSIFYGVVTANSPKEVWFAGADGTPPRTEYLLWNGSAMTKYPPLPLIGGMPTVAGRISGPDDMWLVGSGGGIDHWDGSAWTSVSSPTTANLLACSGSNASDIWCGGWGGEGGAEPLVHWDGTSWTAVPVTTGVASIWANNTRDAWLLGRAGVRHWDGTAWTPSDIGSQAAVPFTVYSTGPNDAWVIAGAPGSKVPNLQVNILHWTGGTAQAN